MKKIFFLLFCIFLINSCSIWNIEIVNSNKQDKILEKVKNLTTKVDNLEEELKTFRKENLKYFVEKNIKVEVKNEMEKIKAEEEKKQKEEIEKIKKQNEILEWENEIITKKIKENKNNLKIWKYCILDTCLYKEWFEINWVWKVGKIIEKDNFYYNFIWKDCEKNNNKNCILASKISKIKNFLSKTISFSKENKETIFINNFKDFFIKTNIINQNNKINIFQNIYDKNWNKIIKNLNFEKLKNIFPLFEKKIKINNLEFGFNPIINWVLEKNIKIFNDKNYLSSKEIEKIILWDILNSKKIYKNYIFTINKEKNIYISYFLLDKKIPEKLIYLWVDKKYLQNILKDSKIINKDLNNKILWYFKKYDILDLNNKKVTEYNPRKKAIFEVKKFDNSWNYLLYFTDFYTKKEQ